MNIHSISESINIPISQWPSNCYAIAHAVAPFVPEGYRPVYGKWNGPISKDSIFAGRPIMNHGWLYNEEEDLVIDPTRFVFEASEPYIYEGQNSSEYDLASQDMAMVMFHKRPLPKKDAGGKNEVSWSDEADQTARYLMKDFSGIRRDYYSDHELFYLANAPVVLLGSYAPEVYTELKRIGCKAFIPIDNWELVMRN